MSLLQKDIQLAIEDRLTEHTGSLTTTLNIHTVGGGSINDAFHLETTTGSFFLKVNSSVQFPGMFEAEAKGLEFLDLPGVIRIPKVIFHDQRGDQAFLVLEYLESGPMEPDFWENFGQSIAMLHKFGGNYFGMEHENYIGSLVQHNKRHDDWVSFFRSMRLAPQVKMAMDAGKMPAQTARHFERLYHQLPEIFPRERPALLHGDLWSGNYMCGPDGKACIFDPAVYYGHREMDIAMTQLFGGYNQKFYDAYNEVHPLSPEWMDRIPICNLYPLLVHVNLFGGGYLASVQRIVEKY